jgi:hypothetical protein
MQASGGQEHPKVAAVRSAVRERLAKQEADEAAGKDALVQKAASYLETFYQARRRLPPRRARLLRAAGECGVASGCGWRAATCRQQPQGARGACRARVHVHTHLRSSCVARAHRRYPKLACCSAAAWRAICGAVRTSRRKSASRRNNAVPAPACCGGGQREAAPSRARRRAAAEAQHGQGPARQGEPQRGEGERGRGRRGRRRVGEGALAHQLWLRPAHRLGPVKVQVGALQRQSQGRAGRGEPTEQAAARHARRVDLGCLRRVLVLAGGWRCGSACA